MEFNKYQTPIDQLVYNRVVNGKTIPTSFKDSPQEVQDEFNEILATVPLVQWLISKDRPNIKDLPRNEDGKAIWRIEYPPIIENVDYFRPTALHYMKTGKLTDLRPNPNPNSSYMKWLNEEVRRIRKGYLREEDGAYITGDMYFYLNYCPIVLTKKIKGTDTGYRTMGFPEFWEGVLWRYTGWQLARTLGQHFGEISARGKSKSYTLASKLTKIFVVGEKHDDDASNPLEKDNERGVVMAYQKEFLTKDGTLNKFEDMFDFLATNTQFPRKTLTRSLGTMDWVMGYIDLNTGAKKGTGNEIMGVAIKDDPNKARGKRPHPLFCNVVTPDGIKKWKDIQVGDLLFTPDGKTTKAIAIPFEGEDEIFKITLRDGRVTYAGGDHLFPVYYWKGKSGKQRMVQENLTVREIKEKHEKYKNGYKFSLSKTEAIEYETKQKLLIDPYCMGLYLGDGCFNKCQGDKLDITMLPEDFNELKYAIPYRTVTEVGRTITQKICLLGDTTFSNKYNGFSKSLLTYYGLYKKDAGTKFIPREYLFSSIEERTSLLQGLLDTDGTCSSLGSIEYASKSKQLAEDVAFLVRSLGMNCSIYLKKFIRKDNVYYRVKISATSKELFKLKRKQARVRTENKAYGKSFELRTAIKSIESIGKLPCKCVTVDNKDGLYLIDDFIPTHNSQLIGLEEFGSFPNVAEVIKTAEPSVKEGDLTFGLMVAIGTGGSEGNDFSGALDMIYHPSGSHFLSFENVWDKAAQSRGTSIFCFPSYINRKGCYNEDGISDVTKAIFAICWERYIAKYENPDPMALTRTKAENPITLQDAIMKRDGTKFPVAQISERIQEIDLNPNFYDKILSGKLIQRSNGEVEFEPTGDKPIHKFPTKDNKVAGAVEIKELPKKNREGRVYAGRYIGSLDPIDDDNANTMSLVSCFILDLWTDEIVAEWTGRLNSAEDCYEVVRLLAKFYNAKIMYEQNKKGIYSYMKMMNSLYLLAETPQFIKDKEDSKIEKIGNKMYGINATNPINNYGRDRLKDFMLKPKEVTRVIDGQEQVVTIPNVMTWWNRALLEEARGWNPDGNFDRISAMGMLMLYREEVLVLNHGEVDKTEKTQDIKSHDPFFERNYHPKTWNKPVNQSYGMTPNTAEKIDWWGQ